MTIRLGPAELPHPAVDVFDALVRVLPYSDLQVVWADRGMGMITAIAGPTRGQTDLVTYTLTLQVTGPASSILLLQANGHGNWGRRPPGAPMALPQRLVAQALATLST